MALDVTTLALAVDSTQVSTANTVLDKFAAAGERAEGASTRLAKASTEHGRAINTALVPAANKGALAFKSLAEAQAVLGDKAAAQLQAAGAFGAVETKANAAAAAVRRLGDESQAAAQRAQTALSARPAGAVAPIAATADAGSINALAAATGRADAQAQRLAGTLGRDVAAGATRARTSLGDLSSVTTSLGASSFVNFDKVTTSLGATAAKADEATLAVHRLRNEIALTGPLATATTSLGAVTGPANRPAPGLRGAIEQRDINERARRALDPRLAVAPAAVNPAATRPIVAGNEAVAKSAKFAAFQQQQLGFQIHDFFVQVASGSNPLTAFIQQGSQLSGTFGGAGNAFRAVTALITPMRAAIAVAAASIGGLALALSHAESAARDLATVQAQLSGTGREGMFSTGELKAFINELAQAPGVTRDTATAIVSELSKVHDIGGGIFKDLAGMAADYAKATGTDIPTAAKTLAKALADPERGIKQLDNALGTISSTTILTVERLSKMGNTAGAQRVAVDALGNSIKGLAANAMTPLEVSVDKLGKSWKNALQELDNSQGLRTLNALLAKTVEFVDFLVRNADKIGGLGNVALAAVPGVGVPAAVGGTLGSKVRSAIFGEPPKNPTASGKVAGLVGAVTSDQVNPDEEIKRALEAGKAYQSTKGRLAELSQERTRYNAALQQSIAKYGAESEQAKKLRDILAGVDERIASARKKGSGGGNEAQQVLDAQLEQRLKASRDILERERDAMAFQQRYLQGVFQSGALSLVDFYEEKRAAIERGTAAELAALEKERVAVEKHLADTVRTSPKDLSAQERDRTRLNEIEAQAEKARLSGSREAILADQQQADALKQLTEQVTTYRASLLELQGDEAGAARLRAQQAIQQASLLAAQSQRTANPITAADLSAYERAIDSQNRLAAARQATSQVNDILVQEEERIALAVRTGAIGEIEAMQRTGAARAKVAAELEKIVQAQEEIAARVENSQNWQLQIDTSRARLELEKLKAEIDPLKEHFDNLLKDSGANFLEDLMNGVKGKDALKSFFGSISREINSMVAKELSADLFGKNGALGGAGGFLAKIFGKKPDDTAGSAQAAVKPVVDTTAVTASLASLQAAGADPATAALGRLTAAADAAAGALGAGRVPGVPFDAPALTTGDFARLDRGQTTGESAVMGMFKEAEKSGAQLASVNDQAANSILQFASAAARGGDAMSLLPGIIQSIIAAASVSRSGSGGGNFLSSIFSLFGGGGGGTFTGTTGLEGMSPDTLALFFHSGGIVGKDKDARPVPRGVFASAGRYHAGGVVAGAAPSAKAPQLAANEVPAILMGGPKGSREEVLHARDPRHADNLAPAVLKVLQSAPNKLPALLAAPVAAQRAAASSSTSSSERSTTVRERTAVERQIPALFKAIQGAPGVSGRAFALSVVAGIGGPGGRGGDSTSTSVSRGGDALGGDASAIGGRGGDSIARAQGGAGGNAEAVSVQQRVPGATPAGQAARGAGPAAAAAAARILFALPATSERSTRELRESVLREARQSSTHQSTTTASVLQQAGAAGGNGGDGGDGGDGAATPRVDVAVSPSVLALIAAPRMAGDVAEPDPVAAAERTGPAATLDLRALAGQIGDKREVFATAQKYHSGGIVAAGSAGAAAADSGEVKLAANEVPAILMGGPKGQREEVLTASDPRHRDNISPSLLKVMERSPGAVQVPQLLQAARQAPGNPGRALALTIVDGRGGDARGGDARAGDGGQGGIGGEGGRGGDARSQARSIGGTGGRGGDAQARGFGGSGGRALAIASAAARQQAGAAPAPALKAGEVPAILLRNEEVITAQDPRHRDRITPELAGAFAAAPRYHTGGIVGLTPDRRSDVLKPVRNEYLNAVKEGGEKAKQRAGDSYTINVNATPGMTAQQAMNQGRAMRRGMQAEVGRRTRDT